MEDWLLRRGSMLEQGSVRSPPTKEEELEEATSDELTTAPIPQSGVKLSPGRKGGWGKLVLMIWFYLPLSYFDLMGKKSKLTFPNQVCFSVIVGELKNQRKDSQYRAR